MKLFNNMGTKLLALLGAFLLWGVSHGTSSIERGFDVPVVPESVPDHLVVVGRSSDAVNIRVRGSRAALRNLSVGTLEYPVDLEGARPGTMSQEVDLTALDLPRGAQIVSRSPASLDIELERRSSRAVRIRPDVMGEVAPGFELGDVTVTPPRIRVTGARTEVLRLTEVLTETVDVTGATAAVERPVRLSLGGSHLWIDDNAELTVRVDVVPVEPEGETE